MACMCVWLLTHILQIYGIVIGIPFHENHQHILRLPDGKLPQSHDQQPHITAQCKQQHVTKIVHTKDLIVNYNKPTVEPV